VLIVVADAGGHPAAPDTAIPDTSDCFRLAGAVLPALRIGLVGGSTVRYLEHEGRLYYDGSSDLKVGSGGHAVILVRGGTAVMGPLEMAGKATPGGLRIAGFGVWDVKPGTRLFGITVTETSGPRPLGRGI
jgi:hypothetical protein